MVGISILPNNVKCINIELGENNAKGSIYLKIIKMICGNIIITVKHDLQLCYILY